VLRSGLSAPARSRKSRVSSALEIFFADKAAASSERLEFNKANVNQAGKEPQSEYGTYGYEEEGAASSPA
jgi:hypothetical protein